MIDISVSGLVKEFEVGKKILDGLTFQVDAGERAPWTMLPDSSPTATKQSTPTVPRYSPTPAWRGHIHCRLTTPNMEREVKIPALGEHMIYPTLPAAQPLDVGIADVGNDSQIRLHQPGQIVNLAQAVV